MCYPEYLSVADARQLYFEANGFSEDSYRARWVHLKIGPIPFAFPNSAARRRAVRLHDLHHIATEYDTNLRGEAEQSAWELAAGCHKHWFAWLINLSGLLFGILAPRRTWRAWRRGRHSKTLYAGEFHPALLEQSVGSLRRSLEL